MKKRLKRTAGLILAAVFLAASFVVPVSAEDELSDVEIENDDVSVVLPNDVVRFVLDARWGFVNGNPERDTKSKVYDGSISAISGNSHIDLKKRLKFERNDLITSNEDPVAWTSVIAGHWDGVVVSIKAESTASLTVTAGSASVTKTAQEWRNLRGPAIVAIDDDEVLEVRTHPNNKRRIAAVMWWGKARNPAEPPTDLDLDAVDTSSPALDFSGSVVMTDGSFMKLKKALRFESNDSVTEHDRNHVAWSSTITTGRDGLAYLLLPSRSDISAGFTVNLPNLPTPWSKSYMFNDIDGKHVREMITIDGVDYVLVIGKRSIVKRVIKAKGQNKLYLLEDGTRRPIPSLDILKSQQLDDEDVVELEPEELESYAEGDELTYGEGEVIDEEGGEEYVISNGKKRRIRSKKIVDKFSDVRNRLKKKLNTLRGILEGRELDLEDELPDGSLVKVDGDSAVWEISGGKRRVFDKEQVFRLHRRSFKNVKTVVQSKLQSYKWDGPVLYPDGSLIKSPTNPNVYLINDGLRRLIESEADFFGLGYKFNQVVDLPDTEIVNYPEGDPVISDETEDVIEF